MALIAAPLAAQPSSTPEPSSARQFSLVYAFHKPKTGRDGIAPVGGLVALPDGSLIGTTSAGGLYKAGTIFRIDASGHETVVHHLDKATDGTEVSRAPTLASDGRVYGVDTTGGPSKGGTIWRVDADGANFTVVHAFPCCGSAPREPFSNIVDLGEGRLYGTARTGGQGNGTVWQLDIGTGLVTTLHEFAADSHEGRLPNALLGDAGHLFGTSQLGGSDGHGTVFRLSVDGGFHLLDSFQSSSPIGNLVVVNREDIYVAAGRAIYFLRHRRRLLTAAVFPNPLVPTGLMSFDGRRIYGTVMDATTQQGRIFTKPGRGRVKYLHRFDKFKECLKPMADTLAFAKDGFLYGVCAAGGRESGSHVSGMGTVFRFAPVD